MSSITEHEHLCVAQVPIFNQLPHAQLERIEALVHHSHFAAGETLYLENTPAEALYILHAGQVKIARTSAQGREQLLRVLHPGDFDGDQALFMDRQHSAQAQALAPVTACVLYKKDFQQLLQTYPAISQAVIAALATRIGELETQTTMVTTADVATRLAQYLLTQAQTQGNTLTLPMKKRDLADFLGTTPETLSRKLTQFADKGWLQQAAHRQIKLLDPEALAAQE
ncbi:Crp/Fnr family transcriptional regulator [Lacticaseibacillus baoqingensis]|uniref:Crp/Fnr family transcriptional regulator n=1 Tax=Lacticaseibacillus baoqingensis TaxID=2486013 RepID=A0ABW4E8H6_9LACO|nr:Crp/Fnr family transcriptional regulator [Lacticaseibacillus baoqingensis]